MNVWMAVNDGIWSYGEPIRGMIRRPLAEVEPRPSGWTWTIFNYETDETKAGCTEKFHEAIEAAERARGIE